MIQHHFFFVFVYSLTRFITFCSSVNPNFEACNRTTCGRQTVKYPFYIEGRQKPFCGYPGFGLSCSDNGFPIINISDYQYIVHEISYKKRSIRVSEAATSSSNVTSCAIPSTHNITFEGTRFNWAGNQTDLFLVLGCNLTSLPENFRKYRIGCSAENETKSVLAMTEEHEGNGDLRSASKNCSGGVVETKIENRTKEGINGDVVRKGFVLNWIVSDCGLCEISGGKCGFNADPKVYNFKCYCPDRDHAQKCDPPVPAAGDKSRGLKLGLGIGLGIGLPAILIIVWLIGRWCYRRKHGSDDDQYFEPRNSYSADYSNSDPENDNIYLGVPLFSYKQLQEATNNFDQARVLGDGGFGIVYYGKLRDGREVAVKRLFEHNYRRAEQFRNEVKILAGLRHKNLVSLYGCTSRRSQELLLVYECISNGTVASHLQGNKNSPTSTSLPWPIRIKIAIETASALVYLHASDIIHRDVKTNNILVDNNFNVKVADFGLSRLFPNDVSHVSTAPQGTPGYVDPEYYQCYQLTGKSDVYSFGVVLIELISSKPAVDISRSKDEVNLSSLAMKKIQESAFMELVDPFLGIEKDSEVKRMVVSVGELAFRCLQRDKDLRPSMEEVLKALTRIQSGKGGDEVENLESDDNVNPLAPPPPSMSLEKEEVGLLKKANPPPSSPNSVTDKWTSESSTPNASA